MKLGPYPLVGMSRSKEPFWSQFVSPLKLNVDISCGPENPHLGVCPAKMQPPTGLHKNAHNPQLEIIQMSSNNRMEDAYSMPDF